MHPTGALGVQFSPERRSDGGESLDVENSFSTYNIGRRWDVIGATGHGGVCGRGVCLNDEKLRRARNGCLRA